MYQLMDTNTNTFNSYRKLTENEKIRRIELCSYLAEVNPYLSYLPRISQVYEDVEKFPNEIIEKITMEFKYLDGKFEDKP
jgi:hypothetical protein